MAARKPIPREELAEWLDKHLPPEQIAKMYKTSLASVKAQIQQMNADIEGVLADAIADAENVSDDLTFHEISHPNARAFLLSFGYCGNVTDAAHAARVSRRTHYDWIESLPGYAGAFKQAEGIYADSLERSARIRARDGVLKPIYQSGFKVGEVREYSDTLMLALLKAKKPAEYKDRSENRDYDMSEFDDSELDRLASGEPIERVLASSRRRRTGETTEGAGESAQPAAADLEAAARPADDGDGVSG